MEKKLKQEQETGLWKRKENITKELKQERPMNKT